MTNTTVQSPDIELNHLNSIFNNQIENIKALVNNQLSNLSESLNVDVDSFNEMFDKCESSKEQVHTLNLEISALKDSLKQAEKSTSEKDEENIATIAQLKMKLSRYSELSTELNRLKSLDPDGMKQRIAKLRATGDERLKEINKLRKSLKENIQDLAAKRKEYNVSNIALTEAIEKIKELQAIIDNNDGEVIQKCFKGDRGLECYVYIFNFPLVNRPRNGHTKVINDFNFHVEVRTNYGIGLMIGCTEWCVPLFPKAATFEKDIPSSLSQELAEFFLSRMESSHPHLVDRIDWARNQSVLFIPNLSERHAKLLTDSGCNSVFSLLHITDELLANDVKGMSVATAGQVQELARLYVDKWQKDNWTKEQLKAYHAV